MQYRISFGAAAAAVLLATAQLGLVHAVPLTKPNLPNLPTPPLTPLDRFLAMFGLSTNELNNRVLPAPSNKVHEHLVSNITATPFTPLDSFLGMFGISTAQLANRLFLAPLNTTVDQNTVLDPAAFSTFFPKVPIDFFPYNPQMTPTNVAILPRAVTTMTPLDRVQMIPTEALINPRAEPTKTMTPLDRVQMIPTQAILNPRAEATEAVAHRNRWPKQFGHGPVLFPIPLEAGEGPEDLKHSFRDGQPLISNDLEVEEGSAA